MANTTNYNWETPDDTDLVKDGAAAIRTLGSSIDTTTKNLNPETTTGDIAYRSATANTNTRLAIGSSGQVLTVAAGVPSWATPTVGDITEVQAGTGISVASGTGPIPVVTNTVATAFDAAGDLVYGTGADTFTKLSLGTAGQVLKVNSGATAPEWGAAGGGGATWTTWTPSWDNLTVGNGTVTARYIQIDKVVFFSLKLVFGSTTSVSARPQFTLPVSASSTTAVETANIFAQATDDGVGDSLLSSLPILSDVTKIGLIPWKANSTYVLYDQNITAIIPFTWAVNDKIFVSGNYEVA